METIMGVLIAICTLVWVAAVLLVYVVMFVICCLIVAMVLASPFILAFGLCYGVYKLFKK